MTMHLTGPLLPFSNCNLWMAMFDPEVEDSLSKQERELPDAQLSGSDRRRWRRFRPLEKKRQFLNSRIAVRAILQRELKHSADKVRLDTNRQGQPILLSDEVEGLPQISLSHAGTVVAVAVSCEGSSAGVDIEIVEPLKSDALWRVAVHPRELELWHNPGGMSETEWLRTLWTIKESVWKSFGGIGEISISQILIDRIDGVIIPRVIHSSFANDEFRTQLFAVQCEQVFPGTMLVDQSGAGIMALRGSVSQWISAAAGNSCSDIVRHVRAASDRSQHP